MGNKALVRALMLGAAALIVPAAATATAGALPTGALAADPGLDPGLGVRVGFLADIMTAWTAYKARHIDPSGRVIDNANGDISHSEGQGYAMLIAMKMADREAFDRVWNWTTANLGVRSDRLFAWKWAPGAAPNVADTNNATDGDIFIAWALVEAAELWDAPHYLDAARAIATDIAKAATVGTAFGPVLLPGAAGFAVGQREDGPVVNLSYWVYPALPALKTAAPDVDWDRVFAAGSRILAASNAGPLSLPPEWTSLAGEAPAPAKEFDAVFGYNAIRIPLYLAWGPDPDRTLLARFKGLRSPDADVGPFVVEIPTGAALSSLHENGFRAVSSLVECALSPASGASHRVRIDGTEQNYYPETLNLLAAIAQLERYPSCLD